MSTDENAKTQLQNGIDSTYSAARTAQENGLFEHVEGEPRSIFQDLLNARANLQIEPPNFIEARNYLEQAEQKYLSAVRQKGKKWRIENTYGLHIWAILMFYLISLVCLYFLFVDCYSNAEFCAVRFPSASPDGSIDNRTQAINDIIVDFGIGNDQNPSDNLQGSISQSSDSDKGLLFPQNGVYAVIWGAVGGILNGLWVLWKSISFRNFRMAWSIFFISAPFIGGILGSIVYFLLAAGLLLVSQNGTTINSETNTFIIIIASGYAGFKWEAAVKWFERVGESFSSGGGTKKP